MESRGDDEHEEELPSDLIESNRAGDKQDDVCEVQTTHANCHALTADMRRVDLRPAIQG